MGNHGTLTSKSRDYPPNALENEKRTLSFFLNEDVLYKKNHDMVLLRCIDVIQAQRSLENFMKGHLVLISMGTPWKERS